MQKIKVAVIVTVEGKSNFGSDIACLWKQPVRRYCCRGFQLCDGHRRAGASKFKGIEFRVVQFPPVQITCSVWVHTSKRQRVGQCKKEYWICSEMLQYGLLHKQLESEALEVIVLGKCSLQHLKPLSQMNKFVCVNANVCYFTSQLCMPSVLRSGVPWLVLCFVSKI